MIERSRIAPEPVRRFLTLLPAEIEQIPHCWTGSGQRDPVDSEGLAAAAGRPSFPITRLRRATIQSAVFGRWRRRIAEAAKPHLEWGERVRASVAGTTAAAQGITASVDTLGRWASGEVKTLVVLLTERNLYVLRANWKDAAKIEALESRYPIGSVQVRFDGERLYVGEHTLYPAALMRREAQRLVSASKPF